MKGSHLKRMVYQVTRIQVEIQREEVMGSEVKEGLVEGVGMEDRVQD